MRKFGLSLAIAVTMTIVIAALDMAFGGSNPYGLIFWIALGSAWSAQS